MFRIRQRRSHRSFRPSPTNSAATSLAERRQGRVIALVDARFLGWLMGDGAAAKPQMPTPSADTTSLLRQALERSGVDADLFRVYWYGDAAPQALVDDVVFRGVLDPNVDGGLSVLRALTDDLGRIAANRAADHVLVGSDDERLWMAVDAAQLQGLGVHVLCDDSAQDFAQLQQDDPSWARLLSQADRRVVWSGQERATATGAAPAQAEVTQEVDREVILAHLAQWWEEEPEPQRHDLRDELQYARGIPQEVDRQLLLRLSRQLGHPLTWPEKKVMREGIRRIVLGEDYTPYRAAPVEAGEPAAVESPEAT